jgi:hypothetical protein
MPPKKQISPAPTASEALLLALADPAAARALVGVGFDFVTSRPLAAWVEPEAWVERAARLFDPETTGELIAEHLPRALDRFRAQASARGERLREWVTAELDAELRAAAMRPLQLGPRQLRALAHHEVTEHVMGELVREILERFISAAKPGGQGGGLLGAASRGVFGLASRAASGVLQGGIAGALGEQLEGHLKGLVAGFIQSSMHALLERLALILSAPEVATQLGAARLEAYEALMSRPIRDLAADAERAAGGLLEGVDWREWARLAPELISHNLARQSVRDALVAELKSFVDEQGSRPLLDFIGSPARVALLREEVMDALTPQVLGWAQSEGLRGWAEAHLGGARPAGGGEGAEG